MQCRVARSVPCCFYYALHWKCYRERLILMRSLHFTGLHRCFAILQILSIILSWLREICPCEVMSNSLLRFFPRKRFYFGKLWDCIQYCRYVGVEIRVFNILFCRFINLSSAWSGILGLCTAFCFILNNIMLWSSWMFLTCFNFAFNTSTLIWFLQYCSLDRPKQVE